MSLPNNTLPNADPAIQSGPTPYFVDNTFVRGDHMRANNQRIWGNEAALLANDQNLDSRLATIEGENLNSRVGTLEGDVAQYSLEWFRYGVTAINAYSTIYQQFATITQFVNTRNLSASGTAESNDIWVNAAKSLATPGASGLSNVSMVTLPDGRILMIAIIPSGTTYKLYLYDPSSDTAVASANTPTITVTANIQKIPRPILMPNGKVLICVYSSTTTYKLYIYDPATDTATPSANTPTITVTAAGAGASMRNLQGGKILLVLPSASNAYSLYIYNTSTDTAVASANTPTITVTAVGSAEQAFLPSTGNVLILIYSSTTTYKLYIYNTSTDTAVASANTPTISVTASDIYGSGLCLLNNNKAFLSIAASTTTYKLYIYDPATDTATPSANTPTITVTAVHSTSHRLLPNGKVLILAFSSNTVYTFYLYDPASDSASSLFTITAPASGAWSHQMTLLVSGYLITCPVDATTSMNRYLIRGPFSENNRYQFPVELLQSGLL